MTAAAIRLDAAFLDALYNGLTDAILAVQFGSRKIVHWNKGAEAMFGYSAQEVLGQTTEIIYPDQHSFQTISELATPKIRQQGSWQTEWEYRRRDGSRFPADVVATMIRGAEGTEFYVIVIRDISTRKQAEAALQEQSALQKQNRETIQKMYEELEARVTDRTADLQGANEQLRKEIVNRRQAEEKLIDSERMATIGLTAAKLAHEIANPLQAMNTVLQMLEQYVAESRNISQEMLKSIVGEFREEVNRLMDLLDQFRNITRPQKLEIRPVNLTLLAREVLILEAPHYQECGIRVEENFAADLPAIAGDSIKLKQVLVNLFKNAAEAMSQGGTLTLRAYPEKSEVVFEVMDTGVGIPEGVNVFELFTTSKAVGTGLGLAIVKDIVSAHHGGITYTSELNKGTTFQLRFPLLE
ncbi:MAG TPA: ATP-binding protein [Candidatus Binatia bacterium]|nr:ATP-binding protein [Candidatus Binatia bacterium]